MTEKHEALKGKIFLIQDTFDGELVPVKTVRLIDLKSAVQGLLEEIENIASEFQVKGNNIEDEHPNHPQTIKYKGVTYIMEGTYLSSVGLEILNLIPIIKKWFADVVREDEEKNICNNRS